ncbi:hypothetical protein TWF718_008810 [Orbilia javanica]|uniref:Uncharacterized protein n=1 Tax=Orbilia javanica TaxID=47235 RepID=A0AAN8MV33_9PEZI
MRKKVDLPPNNLTTEQKMDFFAPWVEKSNAKYKELRCQWGRKKKLGEPQLKALLWGFSLNSFRWICQSHHRLKGIEYYRLKTARESGLVEPTIFDDPLLLDHLQNLKMGPLWTRNTMWPLHMRCDGTFVVDKAARSRIEGAFEVVVDEPLKAEIWEEVGGGTPEPARGPCKRKRGVGEEMDIPPPARRCARRR